MGVLHHYEKALAGGHRRLWGKLIGRLVWPNSFLLLVESRCHKFLPPSLALAFLLAPSQRRAKASVNARRFAHRSPRRHATSTLSLTICAKAI